MSADDRDDDRPPRYDDRDRPRRRDDDDFDRPRRKKGGGFPGWAIALIVVGVMSVCCLPVAVGILLPVVQKVREAAARTQEMNNLKQIGLGVHSYHDTYNEMPGPTYKDHRAGTTNPGLSWRVAILPYVEQDGVFRQLKLDEPWDSAANRPVASQVVRPYPSPRFDPNAPPTPYKALVGPGAVFDPAAKEPIKLADVADGLSNTIIVVAADAPVPFSSPQDIPFDPRGSGPPYPRTVYPNGTPVLLGDGSVRNFSPSYPDGELRKAITRDGGEVTTFE